MTHCNAKTSAGGQCRRPAGWGTGHPGEGNCKLHFGRAPQVERKAAVRQLIAQVRARPDEVQVTPLQGLLQVVHGARGRMMVMDEMLAQLDEPLADEDGKMHPLWIAHRLEQKHARETYEAAQRAGLDERMVRLAERQGAIIAAAAEDALRAIDASPEDRLKFVRVMAARLEVLEAQQDVIEG